MKEFFRKLWLYILRFVFSIGYAFGIEKCFDELDDIHDALDDELIENLRTAIKDIDDPSKWHILYKDDDN